MADLQIGRSVRGTRIHLNTSSIMLTLYKLYKLSYLNIWTGVMAKVERWMKCNFMSDFQTSKYSLDSMRLINIIIYYVKIIKSDEHEKYCMHHCIIKADEDNDDFIESFSLYYIFRVFPSFVYYYASLRYHFMMQ